MNSSDLRMLIVAYEYPTGVEVPPKLIAQCLKVLESMVGVIEAYPELASNFPSALTQLRSLKR